MGPPASAGTSISGAGPRAATVALITADAPYGAIAYSPHDEPGDRSFGQASGTSRERTLYDAALNCRHRTRAADCQAVVWFGDGYGSLARSSGSTFGSGWGSSSDEADSAALQSCRDAGAEGCHLIVRMVTSDASSSAEGGAPGRVCFFKGGKGKFG